MKFEKSRFNLDNRQRSGIFILILVVFGLYALVFFHDFVGAKPRVEDQNIAVFQERIDSLKAVKAENDQPKIYPFNPNFITDYKGYTLGMGVEEIDRLLRFREKDKWVNSAEDFQKVTGVSDSLLAVISPYFKFPEWVNEQQQEKISAKARSSKSQSQKKDLNKATFEELLAIPNITEKQARDILNFRKRLGGFLLDDQLFDVFGVPNKVVFAVKDEFTVKELPQIIRMNLNSATASDLATLPYITFDQARAIINFRSLHEGISDLDELLKIDGITSYKIDRIKLYLSTNL
ncbi:MAG: helix-hairpin-helix domain-containing protein [Leeuwenhoekiella sp.]